MRNKTKINHDSNGLLGLIFFIHYQNTASIGYNLTKLWIFFQKNKRRVLDEKWKKTWFWKTWQLNVLKNCFSNFMALRVKDKMTGKIVQYGFFWSKIPYSKWFKIFWSILFKIIKNNIWNMYSKYGKFLSSRKNVFEFLASA